jgi:NADH:ubiquinone oxidoreductase subunit 4 (subunit M)
MNLLLAVLALPLAAFLVALAIPRSSPEGSRMWGLIGSLAAFVASLALLIQFDPGLPGRGLTLPLIV